MPVVNGSDKYSKEFTSATLAIASGRLRWSARSAKAYSADVKHFRQKKNFPPAAADFSMRILIRNPLVMDFRVEPSVKKSTYNFGPIHSVLDGLVSLYLA